ncbi:MAG: hypothetical protein DMG86_10445 [Acidobacteria bacterium]|nr:MAG: hypothetical protein DMG86_10445 [Acidobacteriota bacterium]
MAQTSSAGSDQDDWVHRWLRIVDQVRASQPHSVAPLITTHVLLVQQYRFDSSWQTNSNGAQLDNYGNSRGLEIIPNRRLEVQVAPPPYIVHSDNTADGFGDVSIFTKFRAFSAPEGKGDYFVGLFFGASFPSGSRPNGTGHTVLSPMLALSKGWGRFTIQNTFSGSLPASGADVLGRAFLWNTAFQYGIKGKIWPMIEQNSTFWLDARSCSRPLANRRAAAFCSRRRCPDRCDPVSYIRSSLDLDSAIPLLRGLAFSPTQPGCDPVFSKKRYGIRKWK